MSMLREIQNLIPDCTYHVDIGIGSIKEALIQYNINLNPVYQRDYVWTEEQKQKFVGAIIQNNRSIPPFWFNWIHLDYCQSHSEVVDGKQRIDAIISWLNGDFTAICPCGIGVHYDDLDIVDHRNIKMNVTMDWRFVDLSNDDHVINFYLSLNSGGTVHTKEDLDRARSFLSRDKSK